MAERLRTERFTLSGGIAIVEWPESISAEEVALFEEWFSLVVRKMKREVQKSLAKPAPEA